MGGSHSLVFGDTFCGKLEGFTAVKDVDLVDGLHEFQSLFRVGSVLKEG